MLENPIAILVYKEQVPYHFCIKNKKIGSEHREKLCITEN